jgi:pilus assembly protein Flp/PilA
MKTKSQILFFELVSFVRSEDAQDLVEYALVVALVAFGAIASMNTLATKVSSTFTQIGTSLSTTIT